MLGTILRRNRGRGATRPDWWGRWDHGRRKTGGFVARHWRAAGWYFFLGNGKLVYCFCFFIFLLQNQEGTHNHNTTNKREKNLYPRRDFLKTSFLHVMLAVLYGAAARS